MCSSELRHQAAAPRNSSQRHMGYAEVVEGTRQLLLQGMAALQILVTLHGYPVR